MLKSRTIIVMFVATCLISSISPVSGIHPYQTQPEVRPEVINTAKKVASRGGYFSATYSTAKKSVPLNTIHSWTLTLTARDGSPLTNAEVSVDVDMPEHGHGMNTVPKVSPGPLPGQYIIEGMNFHMPGWWIIDLDVSRGRGRDLARFQLLLVEEE